MNDPVLPDRRIIIPHGGLIHTPHVDAFTAAAPAGTPEKSWLSRVRPGDNQGNWSACAMFDELDVSFILYPTLQDRDLRYSRTNAGAIQAYRDGCADLGRGDEGLSFPEAFSIAEAAGWLPDLRRVVQVPDLSRIVEQPISCGWRVTRAIDNVGPAGCFDESIPIGPDRGLHAMPIVERAHIPFDGEGVVRLVVSNHWRLPEGPPWGWRGLCQCDEAFARDSGIISEMWVRE